MSAFVRVVYSTNPLAFNPNAASVSVGTLVIDETGSNGAICIVERASPSNLIVTNLAGGPVIFSAAFTPSSSGDGTIDIAIRDAANVAMANEIVDVDITSAGTIASVGIAGSIGTLNSSLGATTTSARVSAQTNSAGLISLAFNGAALQAYRFVIVPRRANPLRAAGDVQVTLTGTLPA